MRLKTGKLEYWRNLKAALEEVVPFYERVNTAISFGGAWRWRVIGLQILPIRGGVILDAGIGPGNMACAAAKILRPRIIIGLDPSIKMLKEAKEASWRCGEVDFHLVQGIFEALPFRAGVFDVALCGFALRDAIDLESSLAELSRSLSTRGRLLIIEIGKPDNPLARGVYRVYWRFIATLVARIAARWTARGNPWRWLAVTYDNLPQNRLLELMISRSLKVDRKCSNFGFVNLVIAEKTE
ncbi:MAG: class I SAM-dependent methyltransferase [Candidatus Bathyarchaeia archaeon]